MKHKSPVVNHIADLSGDLRSSGNSGAKPRLSRGITVGLDGEITAMAVDISQGLTAFATDMGSFGVYGDAAVKSEWRNSGETSIRILEFVSGLNYLLSVDRKHVLTVWDLKRLDARERPERRHNVSLKRRPTCIEVNPSLEFALLGNSDGSVDVLDLEAGLVLGNQRIENMWTAHEELMRESGIPGAPPRSHVSPCMDIKWHPVNLDLLLIAYEGGVVLWSIGSSSVVKTWEFVLPPGAPGGGLRPDQDPSDAFVERRPGITCVAWRTDGEMFAAGHSDGCLSFVATMDENVLMMRTLEKENVNKISEKEWDLASSGRARRFNREPIFRLAWCGFNVDQRHGQTSKSSLLVLGGLIRDHRAKMPPGLGLLVFPPHIGKSSVEETAAGKTAQYRRSIIPERISHVHAQGLVHDFVLVPRSSCHYGNAADPVGLLIQCDAQDVTNEDSAKIVSFVEFPSADNSFQPQPLPHWLPYPVQCNSGSRPTTVIQTNVPVAQYKQLLRHAAVVPGFGINAPLTPFEGGRALPRAKAQAKALSRDVLSRDIFVSDRSVNEYPRLLITAHADLKVRFADVSNHLASTITKHVDGDTLKHSLPKVLHHLTWDIRETLYHPSLIELRSAQLLMKAPHKVYIASMSFSESTLEIAVTLAPVGDVLLARFIPGDGPRAFDMVNSTTTPFLATPQGAAALEELSVTSGMSRVSVKGTSTSLQVVDLSNVRTPANPGAWDTFRPLAGLHDPHIPARLVTIAQSGIGFVALADHLTLSIVDLRKLDIIHTDTHASVSKQIQSKHGSIDPNVSSLTWTIASLDPSSSHPELASYCPRLIAVYATGMVRVVPLMLAGGQWLPPTKKNAVVTFPLEPGGTLSPTKIAKTFILDATGPDRPATIELMRLAQDAIRGWNTTNHDPNRPPPLGVGTSVAIYVTSTSISVRSNINGPISAIVKAPSGVASATVLQRLGSRALAVFTADLKVYIFALPDLGLIANFELQNLSRQAKSHAALTPNTISCSIDGDIAHLSRYDDQILLYTLFDHNRPASPPILQLSPITNPVPPRPTADSFIASVASYFVNGAASLTPDQVDSILGGGSLRPQTKASTAPTRIPVAAVPGAPAPSTPSSDTRRSHRPNRDSRRLAEPPRGTRRPEFSRPAGARARNEEIPALGAQPRSSEEKGWFSSVSSVWADPSSYFESFQDAVGDSLNTAAEYANDAKKKLYRESGKASVRKAVGTYIPM